VAGKAKVKRIPPPQSIILTPKIHNAVPRTRRLLFKFNNPQARTPLATKPENESQWYARPDWWVVIFTGLLFSSTTGLWEEIAQGLLTVQLGLEVANQHNRTDDG
jgi:hypothetical protein